MNTEQIYSLVNSVVAQGIGNTAVTAVDTSSLVSLGNVVLDSSTNTEAFLNTLTQRIGKTIIRYRMYKNKLGDMVVDDFTFGAIVSKYRVKMPSAQTDPSYALTNGVSVDHYVVNKPAVDKKIFVTRTPYMYTLTIQQEHLKEAFLSADAMGAFISAIFGELKNAIEKGLEELGRTAIGAAVCETATTSQEIQLVTEYNTIAPSPITAADALEDSAFLEWAGARIAEVYDMFQDMSELFNDGSIPTFSPAEDIRCKMISAFKRKYERAYQAGVFNRNLTDLPQVATLNYWQDMQSGDRMTIKQDRPDPNTPGSTITVTVDNVIAVMYDKDALGTYKKDEIAATSPLNSFGLYYNVVYHERQLWFYDPSENFVVFTLN